MKKQWTWLISTEDRLDDMDMSIATLLIHTHIVHYLILYRPRVDPWLSVPRQEQAGHMSKCGEVVACMPKSPKRRCQVLFVMPRRGGE